LCDGHAVRPGELTIEETLVTGTLFKEGSLRQSRGSGIKVFMKNVLWAVLVGFLCAKSSSDTVPVSLVSLSVRFGPATAKDPLTGLPWESSISSSGDVNAPNGELVLADEDVPYTHQGVFILTDPTTGWPAPVAFALDVPGFVDDNANGVADFFERALSTDNEQTTGEHETADGKGAEFTARWKRLPGRTDGTVVLNLPSFGLTFSHEYSIPSYEGRYDFVRTNGGFRGTIVLTNVVETNEVLSGPWSVTITNNNRLGYEPGTWTGSGGQAWALEPLDALDRTGTNYVSLAGFKDGFPATSEEDYQFWFLIIHSSDRDANGVLDLVESGVAPPVEAGLAIEQNEAGVEITLHGKRDQSYVLEGTAALNNSAWIALQTVRLSGTFATVRVPVEGGARYFRMREGE
jgi:hypothetical protein